MDRSADLRCPYKNLYPGIFLGVLALSVFLCGSALADETERRIEEETRQALEYSEYGKVPGRSGVVFDYGGWLNFNHIDYHDDDNDSSAPDSTDYTRWFDSRVWLRAVLKPLPEASYENEHSFYLRIKNLYSESRPIDTAGGSDNDGPHIDYAYATLDVRPVWMKIGRQYFTVGQGISYGDVNDGIELMTAFPDYSVKTFLSHTLPHQENIDTSVPGYDKESDRNFWGAECSYLGLNKHVFYAYAVVQRDQSSEIPQDPSHDYTYDSEYFGLGGRGTVKQSVSYWWEIIRETGKSFVYDTDQREDISAWAHVLALAYRPKVFSHPSLYFKYAYGSGDKDRESVTDTRYGNTSGKDRNFLYFGFIPTGYALAPQLSNLYFFKTGCSLKPFEAKELLKDLTVAVDYYRYYKVKSSGGIYDPQASGDSDDVGQEIDLNISWRVLSDILFTVQYGHFKAGNAYADTADDSEDYFSFSTTLTF